MASVDDIKILRERTGLSLMECKKALEKEGDISKALNFLLKGSKNKAEKILSKEAKEGIIYSYIHSDFKKGAILELNCETDFVARNEEFKELARLLSMQITAMNPEDTKELLKQQFIKEQNQTVKDLIDYYIAKLGENIKIKRFQRYEIYV